MIVLGIDTATPGLSVALFGETGVVSSRSVDAGRRHTEALAPAIEELCRETGIALTDLDALAVDVGPGLFTGLRVGLATASALGHALARPALGVTSTEILAEPYRAQGGEVVAVVDVRRGEVAWAHYRVDGAVEGSPGLATPEELRQRLIEICALVGTVAVVGDGALRYRDQITAGVEGVQVDIDSPYPSAAVLAEIARRRLISGVVPAASIVPVYLRPPDVRIGWATYDQPAGTTPPERTSGGQV